MCCHDDDKALISKIDCHLCVLGNFHAGATLYNTTQHKQTNKQTHKDAAEVWHNLQVLNGTIAVKRKCESARQTVSNVFTHYLYSGDVRVATATRQI